MECVFAHRERPPTLKFGQRPIVRELQRAQKGSTAAAAVAARDVRRGKWCVRWGA